LLLNYLYEFVLANVWTKYRYFRGKNKLRYKSFIVPVAFVATGAFLLNSELNGKIQIKSGRVFGSESSAIIYFRCFPLPKSI
jgi:hypothetical protein